MALVVTALDAGERALVAFVWAYRARSEREAAQRFSRLARELRLVQADPAVIALAEKAAVDEERHVGICEQLAVSYGHEDATRGALEVPVGAPIGPRRLSLRDRVLYEMIAFCCITESLNASLMMVSYERARDPDVRAALRRILRDEVGHSRMGWAHLAHERAQGRGEFVAKALPFMLAGTVRDELFAGTVHAPIDSVERLADHGELTEAIRLELFEATLADVVFPGLEAVGIDTRQGRAWLTSMRAAPARRAS